MHYEPPKLTEIPKEIAEAMINGTFKCNQRIKHREWPENSYIYTCGRNAVGLNRCGRPLCQKHLNRFIEKELKGTLTRLDKGTSIR